jgi:hypothetical protein
LEVYRVQNPFQWKRYHQTKEHLLALYEPYDKSVSDRLLFHGTSLDRVKKIAEENLDWRRSGEVHCRRGKFYGHGTYFADDPVHSHHYASPGPDGHRYMFACRVLVGLVTKGRPDMRCLPVWGDGVHYDTAVNDVRRPWEFVKFDHTQYYPAFLIKYSANRP